MVVFRTTAFAKQPGNPLPPFVFSILLLVLLPAAVAGLSCGHYGHYGSLVLKPTKTYRHCDIKIHRQEAASAPTIAYPTIENATSANLTTIIMLSPKGQNSVHWLKVDIPTKRLVLGISSRDDDAVPYKGPKPPMDTGEFTYKFYLLSQSHGGNVSIDPYVDRFEKHFKMAEFKSANGMEVIGFFQYRTEYAFNNSERFSVPVVLGLISLILGVLFGV